MTDDKDERMLRLMLTKAEFEELVEGFMGDSEGVWKKLKNADLESAPKHTDEEFDDLEQMYLRGLEGRSLRDVELVKLQARIKELEAVIETMTDEPEERMLRIDAIPCAKVCRHRKPLPNPYHSEAWYCGLWEKSSKATSLSCPYDDGFPVLCPLKWFHHTDAEYDGLKAKLDHANRRIEELCLWGRAGENERNKLRDELEAKQASIKAWEDHLPMWLWMEVNLIAEANWKIVEAKQ